MRVYFFVCVCVCEHIYIYIYILLVGWLVGFDGISTSISYLMPKPIYTYVHSIIFQTFLYGHLKLS